MTIRIRIRIQATTRPKRATQDDRWTRLDFREVRVEGIGHVSSAISSHAVWGLMPVAVPRCCSLPRRNPLGDGVETIALEALLEARVLAGRAELCACDVQAGLGIGVR